MKLFKISQTENDTYDTYDSAVVAAESEDAARVMSPKNGWLVDWKESWMYRSWCSTPDEVTVQYLGEAADGIEAGVICASFNAG